MQMVVMIVAAARTRGIAPDQSFMPQPVMNPRMWFVLTWGAGIAVAVFLSLLRLPEVVEQLIMLALSLRKRTLRQPQQRSGR